MKKTYLKITGVILIIAVMSSVLCGCTEIGNQNSHEELKMYNINTFVSEHFEDKLHEKYPEIEMDIDSYKGANGSGFALSSLEHGDIADIYLSTQPFAKEAQREYLLDLSGYSFINNYTTTMLNELDNEGGIYLIPSGYQLVGISYNKTIMEENGWEVPNSFEELKALAPKIENAGYDVMGAMFNLDAYPFNYLFNIGNTEYFYTTQGMQWKNDFIIGKASAEGNEGLLSAIKYFQEWIDAGIIKISDFDSGIAPQDAFLNGESVFFMSLGLNIRSNTAENGKVYEFGVIPWLSRDGSNNMLTRNITGYFGINKKLAEKGNEEKLADALKLMEFLSTKEGQEALFYEKANSWTYTAPLVGETVSQQSPFYDLNDLVASGNTVPLVYVGWEDLIVPIAQDIKQMMNGDITPEELLVKFDKCYAAAATNTAEIYAEAKEDLTFEDCAKICANAVGIATDSDAALVSLGGCYQGGATNPDGVNWYCYAGDINSEVVNVFCSNSHTISILNMTGKEIEELMNAGFDALGDGNIFPYILTTKGDIELEDDVLYRLAIGSDELTEEMLQKSEIYDMSTKDAIVEYVKGLGSFKAKDIVWE